MTNPEYSPEEQAYFIEVEEVIERRYSQLAKQARITGQTLTPDFVSHQVRRGIYAELDDVAELSQAMPHSHTLAVPILKEFSNA